MKIVITRKDDSVSIIEEEVGSEEDIINAFATALALKIGSMFHHKKFALMLLDGAYETSKSTLNQLYDEREKDLT